MVSLKKRITNAFRNKKPQDGKATDKSYLKIDTMPSGLTSSPMPTRVSPPKTIALLCEYNVEGGSPKYGETASLWSQVKEALKEEEDPVTLCDYVDSQTGTTILHEICKSEDPPLEIVQQVIAICGMSATTKKDLSGCIPLHYAVSNTRGGVSAAVLEALIDANPEAARSYFSMGLTAGSTSPLYRAVQLHQKREVLLVIHEQCPSMLYVPTTVTPVVYKNRETTAPMTVQDTPLNLLWRRYHTEKWECEKFFPGDNSSDEVLFHRKEYRAKACETRDTIMSMLLMLNFDLDMEEENSIHSSKSLATALDTLKGKGHIVHASASLACTAPTDLLKLIIDKNPQEVNEADSKGKLPLHYAAEAQTLTKTSPGYQGKFVIQCLLEMYPAAAQVEDKEGRLPLTLAFQAKKTIDGGLQLLYEAFPNAIENAKLHGVEQAQIDSFLQEMASAADADDPIFVVQRSGVDVHDILGAMWAHEADVGLQMLAIMALVNMTTNNKSAKQNDAVKAITLAGGISSIVRAMGYFPTEAVVQEKACFVLRQLVSGAEYEPFLEVSFAAVGAIVAVIRAMQRNSMDVMLVVAACEALKSLAIDTDSYTQIIGAGGIPAIVKAMEANDTNMEVQHSACNALAHLVNFSSAKCPLCKKDELFSVLEKASSNYSTLCEADATYVLDRLEN